MPGWMGRFARRPDTMIGHDCWIGHGALILPGVRLGHGVILWAGAVVTRDVPDCFIVAGNPARVIRPRFPADVTARIVALAWCDRPVGRIAAAVPAPMAGDLAVPGAMA